MANQFQVDFDKIYTGASASVVNRWRAADYVDKVFLVTPSEPPQYWPGRTELNCRDIPGLPSSDGYDGVEIFAGHVLLWKDDTLKWSDQNDFANWVPVAETVTSARATLGTDLLSEPRGSISDFVALSNLSGSLTEGQFVRIVSNESDPETIRYDYFKVSETAAYDSLTTTSIEWRQSVPVGSTDKIFVGQIEAEYLDWPIGGKLTVDGEATDLKIIDKSRNARYYYSFSTDSANVPDVGAIFTVGLTSFPEGMEEGDVVSIGREDIQGEDLYEVITPGRTTTLKRLGIGSDQNSKGAPISLVNGSVFVTFQNWVQVTNVGNTGVEITPESEVISTDAAKLEFLGLSGSTPPGEYIPADSVFETLDANTAGELENIGNDINGRIHGVVTLNETAYILKERSIQSMQFVGRPSGTFFLRTELQTEGPVGKYSWCRFGERGIAFVGSKSIYAYAGGQELVTLVEGRYWDQFLSEVDLARKDEIVCYHNEGKSEVWFVYPRINAGASMRALVFNYAERSIVIDDYDDSLGGISAIGSIDWELAPSWDSLDNSEKFNGSNKRWYEYIDAGETRYTVIAASGDTPNATELGEDPTESIPRLLLHGRTFSRSSNSDLSPSSYVAECETPDFDFGDPERWKYVDTVNLALYVPTVLASSVNLEVYVGTRTSLDDPVTWSSASTVDIQGGAAREAKVNITASGRYIRLKFRSNTVGADWRISSYSITARMGGTF